jgi:N-acetylneuraminate synthase
MEPEEYESLVREGSAAALSIGKPFWKVQESEYESRRLRRSLYIVKTVEAGEEVTHENVRAIRPGGGAAPKILGDMIGRKFKDSHSLGSPFTESLVE